MATVHKPPRPVTGALGRSTRTGSAGSGDGGPDGGGHGLDDAEAEPVEVRRRPRRWRGRTRCRRRSGSPPGAAIGRARRARSGPAAGTRTLVHRASVATTTSVVFSPGPSGGSGIRRRRPRRPSNRRCIEPVGADHVADRVDDRERADGRVADPHRRAAHPAGHAVRPRRATCPTVAPVPAPTRPIAERVAVAAAASAAAHRPRAVGRTPPDATRSKIAAVGTIGTGPALDWNPRPRGARPSSRRPRSRARTRSHRSARPRRRARRASSARAARSRATPARRRAPRTTRSSARAAARP